ncbi:c-type cytochrome [Methyloceanibacter sp.]|uniref:c-type cytochrome n=1 Tax=Methyloceanibacter sp. TaxID=1965321 RepID=UPI003D6CCF4E
MQKLMMLMVCACVSVAICSAAAVSAEDEDLVAAVKERRDLMKKTVQPAATLGGDMIKGKKPYDATEAAKAMNAISGVPDKYVTLFPKGTEHGGVADSQIAEEDDRSQAKPEIWEDFADFKKIAMKLKDASAKAAGAAEQGKGTFTAAFNDMTKVCKECHESYRETPPKKK